MIKSDSAREARRKLHSLRENIARHIKGKDEVVEQTLIGLVAAGHLLIEDLPGVGKTTLAYCLAKSIDCSFSRIQFTSDLLPTDVLGVSIFDERTKDFQFKQGPIFANIVLADEINRTTPKTQSSLLEVMDRGKVTVDRETHEVGRPFMVFATQNPVDYEGTFPLPESQMDRFLMRLHMGYPSFEHELNILQLAEHTYESIRLEPVAHADDILALQAQARRVFVEDSVLEYLLRIVSATRTEADFAAGVSTRGSLALKIASQAAALLEGRHFVIPDDVLKIVEPVLAHRLSLRRQTSDAMEERRAVTSTLQRIVQAIPIPE